MATLDLFEYLSTQASQTSNQVDLIDLEYAFGVLAVLNTNVLTLLSNGTVKLVRLTVG
jgi:hypothetical protein